MCTRRSDSVTSVRSSSTPRRTGRRRTTDASRQIGVVPCGRLGSYTVRPAARRSAEHLCSLAYPAGSLPHWPDMDGRSS
jgi:hypothetical protein